MGARFSFVRTVWSFMPGSGSVIDPASTTRRESLPVTTRKPPAYPRISLTAAYDLRPCKPAEVR
jgi:hypothetical protein